MQYVTEFASGFIKLFNTGGAVLVTWMKTIVPVVLLLLVLMNAIIAFVGEEKIQRFAQKPGEMFSCATWCCHSSRPLCLVTQWHLPWDASYLNFTSLVTTLHKPNSATLLMGFSHTLIRVNYSFG